MKRKMKKIVTWILFISLMYSCNDKPIIIEYETGHFPESPVNLTEINSEFDDYNSTAPTINFEYLFHFSSNRKSQGQNFDIVGERLSLKWSKVNGTFKIETDSTIDWYKNIELMFDSVNSIHDEFGPYSFGYTVTEGSSDYYWINLLMYSSNVDGNQDIYFIYTAIDNVPGEDVIVSSPQKLNFIDMNANELYPSFYGTDFYFFDEWGTEPAKIVNMIYCSDKNGKYNIYKVDLLLESDIITTISSTEILEPVKLDISSDDDDKCPYVNGNLLVFSSNRPGGYGGFDLYYSEHENGNWSAPVNFGERINTEYNEFRPITLHQPGYDNNLMIFSSNRPGGKGGYDLYYAGIEKMIE